MTVTLEITLSGDRVPAAAARLAQAVRELAGALGEDAVRVVAPAGWPEARPPGPRTAAPDDGLYVYPASRTVLRGGTPVRLTRLEFDLLLFLAEHRDRAFRRLDLLRAVWGYDQTGVRTVDVHVRRLRAKVGEATPLVATVHGVGYRLDERARVRVVWDRRPAPRS
ncbi:MAG TPA: winged helix-turn-helix domain-containing protein [Pilimelia sp.]|nr:winged helix-turn-helix domain-containing protein [Pilimelia sp.]